MNEQKDKLLINLVEPGRIGRCPFNSFFSFQLALPNGRADEKNRIDGPCGTKRMNERREKDLSFYLSGFTSRGGSGIWEFLLLWLGGASHSILWNEMEEMGYGCRPQQAKQKEWINGAERIDLWVEWNERSVSSLLLWNERNEWKRRESEQQVNERNAAIQSTHQFSFISSLKKWMLNWLRIDWPAAPLFFNLLLFLLFYLPFSSLWIVAQAAKPANNSLKREDKFVFHFLWVMGGTPLCRRRREPFHNSPIVPFFSLLCLWLLNKEEKKRLVWWMGKEE